MGIPSKMVKRVRDVQTGSLTSALDCSNPLVPSSLTLRFALRLVVRC